MHDGIQQFTNLLREGIKLSEPCIRSFTDLREKPNGEGLAVCSCAVGAAVLACFPEYATVKMMQVATGAELYARSPVCDIVNRYEIDVETHIKLPENLDATVSERVFLAFRSLQDRFTDNRIGIASACYYLNDTFYPGLHTDSDPRVLIAQFLDVLNEHTDLIKLAADDQPF